MIKAIGVYRQNKKEQRKQKIKENVLIIAGLIIFFSVIAIVGHFDFIDYCVLHNIAY